MDFDKHKVDPTSNQDDYYGTGGSSYKKDDHYSNNLTHNKPSPLLDFDNEGDYYGNEPYSKNKPTNFNKEDIYSSKPERKESPYFESSNNHNKDIKAHHKSENTEGELIHLDAIKEKVKDLIYWRDVRISGALLACSVGLYLYRNLMQTLNKTRQGHVFKEYLDQDVVISPETGKKISTKVISQLNYLIKKARHIFLVEDVMDTVKFGFILWAMTYVGAYFNGLTLFVLLFVSIFTIPKIYSTYKVQINDAANKAKVVIDKNKDIALRNIKDKAQIVKDKVSKLKKKQ
ncbi:unnamed protein product [Gordionus sp. m RMFG-2023]